MKLFGSYEISFSDSFKGEFTKDNDTNLVSSP